MLLCTAEKPLKSKNKRRLYDLKRRLCLYELGFYPSPLRLSRESMSLPDIKLSVLIIELSVLIADLTYNPAGHAKCHHVCR